MTNSDDFNSQNIGHCFRRRTFRVSLRRKKSRVANVAKSPLLFLSTFIGCGWPNVYSTSSVLVYRCLHGSASCCLQQTVCPVASMESRRRLRSVSSSDLIVPATRRSTLGDRAFAVARPRLGTTFRTPFVTLHLRPLSNVH